MVTQRLIIEIDGRKHTFYNATLSVWDAGQDLLVLPEAPPGYEHVLTLRPATGPFAKPAGGGGS